jgi:hypothetical protein
VGQLLCDDGYLAFVPHINIVWDMIVPNPPEFYLWWDKEWLKTCDALLRLPGRSQGSDGEVALAEELGIPVFYDLEDLIANLDPTTNDD